MFSNNKNLKIVLIIVGVLISCLLLLVSCLVAVAYLIFNNQFSVVNYRTAEELSKSEKFLAIEQGGFKLYLENSAKYEGEVIVGEGSTLNSKQTFVEMQPISQGIVNIGDKEFKFYTLNPFNADCLGVYLNGKYIGKIQTIVSGLPAPSDSWMCSGFDFENGLSHLTE